MNCSEDRDDLLLGRKGNRSGNLCAGTLRCFNDALCRLIDECVVITLNPYSDLLLDCHINRLLSYFVFGGLPALRTHVLVFRGCALKNRTALMRRTGT